MNLEKLDYKLKRAFTNIKQEVSGLKQEQVKIRSLLTKQSKNLREEVILTKKDFLNFTKDSNSNFLNKDQVDIIDKKISSINISLNSLEDVRSEITYIKSHYASSDNLSGFIYDLEELKNSLFEISNNTLPRKEFNFNFSNLIKNFAKLERKLNKREKLKKEVKICKQLKKELVDLKNARVDKLEVEKKFEKVMSKYFLIDSKIKNLNKQTLKRKDLRRDIKKLKSILKKFDAHSDKLLSQSESGLFRQNKEVEKDSEPVIKSEGKSMDIIYEDVGGEIRATMVEPMNKKETEVKSSESNIGSKSLKSDTSNKKKSVFKKAIDGLNNLLFEEETQ